MTKISTAGVHPVPADTVGMSMRIMNIPPKPESNPKMRPSIIFCMPVTVGIQQKNPKIILFPMEIGNLTTILNTDEPFPVTADTADMCMKLTITALLQV